MRARSPMPLIFSSSAFAVVVASIALLATYLAGLGLYLGLHCLAYMFGLVSA